MSLLRPTLQPLLRPLLESPLHPLGGSALGAQVLAMFASGEKGVMFDLTSAANLYTDSARTTLVAASGDRIGSITDLSPNGKHASSAGTARPIWDSAGYGTWDAFDDYAQTAAIDFSATDAVTVVASARKASDAGTGTIVELGAVWTTAGGFGLFAPSSNGTASLAFSSRGNGSNAAANFNDASIAAPLTAVFTGQGRISTDQCIARLNGSQVAATAIDQGGGNYRNDPLNIGARNVGASAFFNGRIYRLLVIGRALTTTERDAAERWAAQPIGVTIP